MADPPQFFTEKPVFQGAKNTVVECNDCGWVWAGPRSYVRYAWNEHWRAEHSQHDEPIKLLINPAHLRP